MELTGGVPAYNEERRVPLALRSLLDQELPPGCRWGTIWVVASGSTDRTVDVAGSVDPRIQVVEQSERLGKAAALCEIFRRSTGGPLVLLNADAVAAPGAVARLLDASAGVSPPFAVMARPIPEPGPRTPTSEGVELLWSLQDRFYRSLAPGRPFPNLHDELMLLSGDLLPPIEPGIVNDGGFIASWLLAAGGRAVYRPDAIVGIEVPRRLRDHVAQRRRILWGTRQLARRVGTSPGTLLAASLRDTGTVLRLIAGAGRETQNFGRSLAMLGFGEVVARILARWDWAWGGPDHVRWATVPS